MEKNVSGGYGTVYVQQSHLLVVWWKHTLRNALQVVTAEWEAQRFVRFAMQFGVISWGVSLSTISKMQSQNLQTDTAVTFQYHYTS